MALPDEKKVAPMREVDSPRFKVKAFVMAVSFANLSTLNVWADMLDRQSLIFRRYAVTWQQLVSVTLYVLLLAAVLWVPLYTVSKSGNRRWIRALKWCAFAALMLPLNIARLAYEASSLSSITILQTGSVRILAGILGALAAGFLLWRWEQLSTPVTSAILVILAPSLPIVVASVGWNIYSGPPQGLWPSKPPLKALFQQPGSPRVIWVVFDEWDQALTFGKRPPDLRLPVLDAFRDLSFHAERASSPNRRTVVSIPSIVTGKKFVTERYAGPNELLLSTNEAKPQEKLSETPTIFSEAYERGFNTGTVGSYLPYCRLFETTSCSWYPSITRLAYPEWDHPFTVLQFMKLTFNRQLAMLPFAGRLGITHAVGEDPVKPWLQADMYHQALASSLQAIVDPRLNLVFLHLNVPHPPAIYNGSKQEFSNNAENTYLDNLVLVDRTVQDIHGALEAAGLWDKTTVLLTSDHSLRLDFWPKRVWAPAGVDVTQNTEVPFLLKLPGQKQGFAYNPPMQTVVTKDLILYIMSGQITQPQQVAEWLDHHSPRQ